MRLKILTALITVLGIFLFVNIIQSQPASEPWIWQNCTQVSCEDDVGSVSCNCSEVNISDGIWPDYPDGLRSASNISAIINTTHNQTNIPDGSIITNVELLINWSVTESGGTCSIEIWNGSWQNVSSTCNVGSTPSLKNYTITDIINNETKAENVEVKINHTFDSPYSHLKVDQIYINVSYLPPHYFDSWNLTNSSGAVISDDENFTRNDTVNASAHWFADGIDSAVIEHNGTWSFVNYTINGTGEFAGNWTNYTLNFSNVTEFPLAGNITVRAIYANDSYGQLNATSPGHYFILWSYADAANLSFEGGSVLNGSNVSVLCNVTDSNSSMGIPGYNVSFWKNESFFGSNLTNSSGIASIVYSDNTTIVNKTSVTIPFKCNITDEAGIFYNASVSEASDNLSVVDIDYINISGNFSVYNRGENITLTVVDTSNNTVANVSLYVNLTKYNQSEQNLFNNYSDNYTFNINSSDPVGNWTLFVNITKEGRVMNQSFEFNVSRDLNPVFTTPSSTLRPSPGSIISDPIVQIKNARNEVITYLMNVTLVCLNGQTGLNNISNNRYKNESFECTAHGAYSTQFPITANATDDYNNTGTYSLYLTTADQSGNGGGTPSGGYSPAANCTCTEWENQGCGTGSCSSTQMYQTRVCTPSECMNESQCIAHVLCVETEDFNFTINTESIEIVQGRNETVIATVHNTGDLPITLNITIEKTCCEVFAVSGFELLKKSSLDFPISIHSSLTQATGLYLVTINISGSVVKTKTLKVEVLENPLIPLIASIEENMLSLEQKIETYRLAGVNVYELEGAVISIKNALSDAKNSIEADKLTDLESYVNYAKESASAIENRLVMLGIEKFLAENKWYIIIGAVVLFFLSYIISQILIPFYRLGREIKNLAKKENSLVSVRKETEKQYFTRKIDENTFNAIMIEGQAKILNAKGSIKTKREERSLLLKKRLSPGAVLRWVKSGFRRKDKSFKKAK